MFFFIKTHEQKVCLNKLKEELKSSVSRIKSQYDRFPWHKLSAFDKYTSNVDISDIQYKDEDKKYSLSEAIAEVNKMHDILSYRSTEKAYNYILVEFLKTSKNKANCNTIYNEYMEKLKNELQETRKLMMRCLFFLQSINKKYKEYQKNK